MKLKTIFLLIVAISVLGCNGIDKKNLEVIEGIQLGTTNKVYQKQIDSLGINEMSFYTKSIFLGGQSLENNRIRGYISDIVNLSDYGNSSIGVNHYGILCPINLIATDNVIGLSAILGHTATVLGVPEYEIKSFNQNVASSYIDEIKRMLKSKYGEPTLDGYESKYNDFYVLEGNGINEYRGDESRKGKVTKWETEYLKIELFEGLPSINAKYSDRNYSIVIQPTGKENDIVTDFNQDYGESPCVTYAYIKYKLKFEAIEKLGLDNKKL